MSQAAQDVLAERERQKSSEGWSEAHDDRHADGSIGCAAACYAIISCSSAELDVGATIRRLWPWDAASWKPKNQRRDLVRAGALIIAEIERLDRAAIAEMEKGT